MSKLVIDRFVGEFSFLSNFHPSTISYNGHLWPTVEHAYQAAKTDVEDEKRLIREAKTPGVSKKLGRSVTITSDWTERRFIVMKELIHLKFQNPLLGPMLVATYPAELVEVNFWNDRVWGVCRGVGENHLGKILMQERARLIAEAAIEPNDFQD